MTDKLPPAPQSFYDENRDRFGADYAALDLKQLDDHKCPHTLVKRISPTEVRCQNCTMGWIDQGHFIIENDRLTGVK